MIPAQRAKRMPAHKIEPKIIEPKNIEALCAAKGMRMTEQRRTIARVLESADGDGVTTFTAAGDWVALRLRCEAAERCADAGLAGFELRSAT